MRKGIVGGGNLIVDYIKIIDYYPNKNMMCNIVADPRVAIGGCPHNVLIDLAKMEVDIPLYALGLVGTDSAGDLVLEDFQKYNVNTDLVSRTPLRSTSFTDAMIESTTGNRTFFHYGGANSELDFEHFLKAKDIGAKIFHLANLLHLEKLDSDDPEYGLISARVLKYLIEAGYKTSVDLVSVKSDLFAKVVQYCLKYIDYIIINEIEAESLSNLPIRTTDGVNFENLKKTAEFLISKGVRNLVVIHFPEGGYSMDTNYNETFSQSFMVESKYIKSAVGAGDAFCSGILYSLHEGLEIKEALKIANACARFNLFDATATGGAQTISKVKSFLEIENKK
jgi:sugar/nucleoside kinase (ribokinase family)